MQMENHENCAPRLRVVAIAPKCSRRHRSTAKWHQSDRHYRRFRWKTAQTDLLRLDTVVQCRLARSLYRLQIRVGCWVSQNSQHRHDLAFVVKCMSYDVQQNKGRTP